MPVPRGRREEQNVQFAAPLVREDAQAALIPVPLVREEAQATLIPDPHARQEERSAHFSDRIVRDPARFERIDPRRALFSPDPPENAARHGFDLRQSHSIGTR
jgi:hypothetical protein